MDLTEIHQTALEAVICSMLRIEAVESKDMYRG